RWNRGKISFSKSATLRPAVARSAAAVEPAGPPPITHTSAPTSTGALADMSPPSACDRPSRIVSKRSISRKRRENDRQPCGSNIHFPRDAGDRFPFEGLGVQEIEACGHNSCRVSKLGCRLAPSPALLSGIFPCIWAVRVVLQGRHPYSHAAAG